MSPRPAHRAPAPAAGPPALPSAFVVRQLRVDLTHGFAALWAGGDAFRTHYLTALSMSFPEGEQYFIDAVKAGAALLPAEAQLRWAPTLRGFVGQEATHRFLHAQFNAELARQGLVNHWQGWIRWRVAFGTHLHPRNHVAVTAACEHVTAVLSHALLADERWLADAEPDLALLWRWHAIEESEHRAVAFDLYRELGGGERRRVLWYLYVLLFFVSEASLQTLSNLWRSGRIWRPGTWWQTMRFVFGPRGLITATLRPLCRYLKPGFHPQQSPVAPQAHAGLAAMDGRYRIVAE